MDIQSVAPEIIQDTESAPVPAAHDPNKSSTAPISIPVEEIDDTFSTSTIDLISSLLPHTSILSLSNEFFAPATSLLSPLPPISKPNTFIPTGAWYDGWETRRHNSAAYDYVVIRLGVDVGRVRGVELDTAWFTGNNAEGGSVEGLYLGDDGKGEEGKGEGEERDWEAEEWMEVLPMRRLGPSRRHAWIFPESSPRITHVRLRNYPDGGIARFRLYGLAEPFPSSPTSTSSSSAPGNNTSQPPLENLASITSGALITAFSDAHYGKPINLLLPGRGVNMGDGWETKRSRTAGHEDWCVVRLSGGGRIEKVVVDTKDFKGNYPRGVRIEGRRGRKMEEKMKGDGKGGDEDEEGDQWKILVEEREWEIGPDREHEVEVMGKDGRREMVVGEVKVVMVPDGGIKRVRVWGRRVS